MYASSSEGEHPTQCICSFSGCAPSDEQAAQPNIEVISIVIVVIDFLISFLRKLVIFLFTQYFVSPHYGWTIWIGTYSQVGEARIG